MVPVAVHKVFGDISLSLVQRRCEFLRSLDGSGNGAREHNLLLPGIEGELPYSVRNVGQLDRVLQACRLAALWERHVRLPDLSALEEINGLAVQAPTGIADAPAFFCERNLVSKRETSILRFDNFLEEQIPAGTVFFNGSVTDSVENPSPIGRQPGVGKPAERKKNPGTHGTVFDLNVRRTDEGALLIRLLFSTTCNRHNCCCREGNHFNVHFSILYLSYPFFNSPAISLRISSGSITSTLPARRQNSITRFLFGITLNLNLTWPSGSTPSSVWE